MLCPTDQTKLMMTSRDGIEIDYCPECRGVWLDRGELDKLIERNAASGSTYTRPAPSHDYPPRPAERRHHDEDDYDHSREYGGKGRRKRESFLGDLFDF